MKFQTVTSPWATLASIFLISASASPWAYELGTHARITYSALLQSDAYTNSSFIEGLGISGGWRADLGTEYNDAIDVAVAVRTARIYDQSNGKLPARDIMGIDAIRFRSFPEGWLMSGAVREDDSGRFTGAFSAHVLSAEAEPHDDPWTNFNRFCNHFFDPFRNRAYSGVCPITFEAAPIWALGSNAPFALPLPLVPNPVRINHFTLRDAREQMWLGLTGIWRDSSNRFGDADRRRAWATVFRSLGDILHLNQDMAQPQHTRDEGHGYGHDAWYEKYMEGRAKGQSTVTYSYLLTTLEALDAQPLTYVGYPKPEFNSFAEYWSTGLGAASNDGKGLADYSNRGFFTPSENFGRTRYSYPLSDRAAYQTSMITRSNGWTDTYLDGTVRDTLMNTQSRPIHMTRSSLLDEQLVQIGVGEQTPPLAPEVFTIDRYAFDDRAELLIPRAVAYSAGLLDHFFRGRLRISPPDDGVYAMVDHAAEADPQTGGFSAIKAKVANATAGDAMTSGTLIAIVKFHRDVCYAPDLSGQPDSFAQAQQCRGANEEMITSDLIELPNGLPVTDTELTFRFASKIPINATDLRLQIAFQGTLGEEPGAVVVAARDLTEPTYFTFFNGTDYARIGSHVYSRNEISADPQLLAQIVPQSCVDHQSNPPQLQPSCLQPALINATMAVGSTPKTVTLSGLPARRFARIAFLAEGQTTGVNQLASTCSGAKPFTLNNLRWQLDIDPYSGAQTLYYGTNMTVRGIKSWFPVACVLSGDGNLSDTPDDRLTKLDELADKTPFPVAISPI